jgi:peptidoglycan-N-acetylglucosamine deacetylase
LVLLLTALSASAQQVALTFDDLPSHGNLPPGMTRVDVAKGVLRALVDAKAPRVYGFINAQKLHDDPSTEEVLRLWTAAGFPLGSHTWSHMDLRKNSAEAFEAEIAKNEPDLRRLMPSDGWHWFRYPYLHEGDTPAKKHAVAKYLADRGYTVAEVSLDFNDYAWNGPYARCVAKHDDAGVAGLRESYLAAAAESLKFGQQMSRQVYGRDIKHVMLLHIGAFQTVMLPKLIELLQSQGWKLITLPEAESDRAYRGEPPLKSDWDDTLLEMMMRAKGLKPPGYLPAPRVRRGLPLKTSRRRAASSY